MALTFTYTCLQSSCTSYMIKQFISPLQPMQEWHSLCLCDLISHVQAFIVLCDLISQVQASSSATSTPCKQCTHTKHDTTTRAKDTPHLCVALI